MKAFEEVWSLIKMPAKGWECPECKMPMMVQVDEQSLQCMNCHAVALTPARKARNPFGADSSVHQEIQDMLDHHKELGVQQVDKLGQALTDLGTNVVEHPRKKVDYNPRDQFHPLERMLNELGFTSIGQLMQDYLRLKAQENHQDLRGMGLPDEAQQMEQEWVESIMNRQKPMADPFISQDRGEAW
tara:strand:+ start:120 stop:677 length:558 start_codon:yes stop_codon:yes gene_type:complete